MAGKTSTTPTEAAPKKERKPARTIAERIAELQAKEAERKAKSAGKTEAALTKVDEAILKVEPKLIKLLGQRTQLRTELGWTADENGDINVPPAEAVEDTTDETVAAE